MKLELARAEGHGDVLRASERDWARDGFGPDARFRAIIAERGAEPVGMATYSEVYVTALGGAVLSLQDLYVAPGARRLGAGRALVAHVAAAAVGRGLPLLQLNVMAENPARKFYRRLGFGHLSECLTYAVGGEAMLALALPLPAALEP